MTVLAGLRVLDLGRFIAAPYCGMILAHMGAEVIRVERPGGEEDRRLGLKSEQGENLVYPALAHHKKAITLDLSRPGGRQVLADLVARCDVFLHNFGLRGARSLELTYDDVRALRRDIIYAGISCYGSTGPHAERTGFDPIAQVVSGAASLTGTEIPLRSGVPWVDFSTGLSAALGIVLALRDRDRSGEGQEVDCAMLRTAVSFTAPMVAEALITGQERPRVGNRAAYLGPSDLYRCRDGWVYLAAATEQMWRSLMTLIGRPDLVGAPGTESDLSRFASRGWIDPLVAAWMEPRTCDEALAALEAAHVPCGRYLTTREVPDDPQVRALELLPRVDLQAPGLESVPVSAPPFRLSRAPAEAPRRPPRVGEHNREIYGGLLGYGEDKLATLAAAAVI